MGFSTEEDEKPVLYVQIQPDSRLQDLIQSSPIHFRQLYSLNAIIDPAVGDSPINSRLVLSRSSIVALRSEPLDSVEVT